MSSMILDGDFGIRVQLFTNTPILDSHISVIKILSLIQCPGEKEAKFMTWSKTSNKIINMCQNNSLTLSVFWLSMILQNTVEILLVHVHRIRARFLTLPDRPFLHPLSLDVHRKPFANDIARSPMTKTIGLCYFHYFLFHCFPSFLAPSQLAVTQEVHDPAPLFHHRC